MANTSNWKINTIDNKEFANKKMMKILGVLCFLLAPFSFIGAIYAQAIVGGFPECWHSISATFYTPAAPLMIILLGATGIVFFSYTGYDIIDNIVTSIAGLAALAIIICPCMTPITPARVGILLIPAEVSNIIHCTAAGILFGTFAYMIGFRFTKHNSLKIKDVWYYTWHSRFADTKKATRNKVYYICAFIIVVFMISQVVTSTEGISWMTIINEDIMLTAFSVAWLTKSGALKRLNDD